MIVQTRMSLGRVWAIAVAIFVVAVVTSRARTSATTPMPAYVIGVVGLLGIGWALVLSWRRLGVPGAYTPATRRVLRAAVALGVILWLGAMLVPFL